jgi:hypothetical protein
LQENKVGKALLHSTVASSVPPAVWPVVLSKVTENISEQDDSPLDGLFGVVRGLFLGGHLHTDHTDAALPLEGHTGYKRARLD